MMPILRKPPVRHCTYCPEPEANACVRTTDGAHIYAHKDCARKRNVVPLYVFTDESSRNGR